MMSEHSSVKNGRISGRKGWSLPWRRKPEIDIERHPHQVTFPSSTIWEVSILVGRVAAIVTLIAATLVVLRWPIDWRDKISTAIPASVHKFLESDTGASPKAEEFREVRAKILGDLRQSGKSSSSTASSSASYFTIGSTREVVREAQGPPTKVTDSVWYYGSSQVHFVGGRVIAWHNSPENPLKIR